MIKEEQRELFRRLLGFLVPHRAKFIGALLAMVLYGATDGLIPLLIRGILDQVFGAQNKEWLYFLPGVIVVFAVFRGVCGFVQHYLSAAVGLNIIRDVRNVISRHLLSLSPAFFERYGTAALLTRMSNDSLQVKMALTDSLSTVLRDTVRVIALMAAAIYLDPVLALIALVGFPLGIYPVMQFGKRIRKLSRKGQDQFGGLSAIMQEGILGHRIVQAFTMEGKEQERFERENERLTKTLLEAERYGALSSPTNEFVASVAMAGVILYGGLSVISGVRTQGDFIAFITSLFLLYEPLKKLGRVNYVFQTGIAAAERIFEVLDMEPEIRDCADPVEVPAGPLDVEFNHVWFKYNNATEEGWAIRDINLKVKAGEVCALVGMSGGGKSTIVNLLPRFYDPVEGSVLLGGIDLRKLKLESLRQKLAVVSQHTFLFDDTVYNNILFGRFSATKADVYAAAEAANALQFIEKLPQGMETPIGEQGMKLSGGERARIALARALLRDAPILILDEATASLDSESEALVQEAIDKLMKGRTVFVIAHRLSTVRNADYIAVMKEGRIVEFGSHDQLMRAGGEYAKLCSIQYSGEAKVISLN